MALRQVEDMLDFHSHIGFNIVWKDAPLQGALFEFDNPQRLWRGRLVAQIISPNLRNTFALT